MSKPVGLSVFMMPIESAHWKYSMHLKLYSCAMSWEGNYAPARRHRMYDISIRMKYLHNYQESERRLGISGMPLPYLQTRKNRRHSIDGGECADY